MKDTRKAGQHGEDVACSFLQYKGYSIIERNFTKPYGEIDIIARDGEYTVFVEVKSRYDASFSRAADAVSKAKMAKLRKTASMWLSMHGAYDKPARFDVIEVYTGTTPPSVRHIKNAF